MVLQLERSGFVPGEKIRINAEIINQSNRKVKQSIMELKQGLLYKTPNGRQREITKIIETVKRDGIPPGSIDQWENESLTIPPIPPSFLRGSEFISIKYELVFTVDPGISLTIPVIIGTIPYHPESLNRVTKALPWKEPRHPAQLHNGDGLKLKPKLYIDDDDDESVYVKSSKFDHMNNNANSNNSNNHLIIEEID